MTNTTLQIGDLVVPPLSATGKARPFKGFRTIEGKRYAYVGSTNYQCDGTEAWLVKAS